MHKMKYRIQRLIQHTVLFYVFVVNCLLFDIYPETDDKNLLYYIYVLAYLSFG